MRFGAGVFFDFFTLAAADLSAAAAAAAAAWAASFGWRGIELLHDSERDDSEKLCRARRSDEVERRWLRAQLAAPSDVFGPLLQLSEDVPDDEADDEFDVESEEDEDEEDDDESLLLPENEISRLLAKLRRCLRWPPDDVELLSVDELRESSSSPWCW